jgi:hypothetical protein
MENSKETAKNVAEENSFLCISANKRWHKCVDSKGFATAVKWDEYVKNLSTRKKES